MLPASLLRQVRLRTGIADKAVSSSPPSRPLVFSFCASQASLDIIVTDVGS